MGWQRHMARGRSANAGPPRAKRLSRLAGRTCHHQYWIFATIRSVLNRAEQKNEGWVAWNSCLAMVGWCLAKLRRIFALASSMEIMFYRVTHQVDYQLLLISNCKLLFSLRRLYIYTMTAPLFGCQQKLVINLTWRVALYSGPEWTFRLRQRKDSLLFWRLKDNLSW